MYFCLALVLVAACQAAVDVPADVLTHQITCDETSIQFSGSQGNFPRYAGSDLSLGACALGDDFSVNADFNACGLSKSVVGNKVSFSGALTSAAPAGVITRRKPINILVGCEYDRVDAKTAGASVQPNLVPINGDLTQEGATIDLYLNLLDSAGAVVASGNNLAVEVGEEVTAVVGGTNLDALGLNAYATNCYATPSEDPNSAVRYDLIRDNCPDDATAQVAAKGNGQEISFESFSFTSDVSATVYLHCDLQACEAGAGCGVCENRKRRSIAYTKVMMSKLVTVKL